MRKIDTFDQIIFEYNTGPIPPPFCHNYKIIIYKSNSDQFKVELKLEYYDRDEIAKEEIFNEGFSLDDDYVWNGNLPTIWGTEITKKLTSSNWKKKPSPSAGGGNFVIKLKNLGQSELLHPAEIRSWEVFAQEIIQAVFELSEKEAPLQINFLCKQTNAEHQLVDFIFSFATQSIQIDPLKKEQNSISWADGQKLLKYIFSFDYYPEKGFDKIPKNHGNYISPGDGFWYELTANENANKGALERVDKLVETLKSYG